MSDPIKGTAFIPLANSSADSRFQEAALNVLAHRQTLIAANIANADTPRYKAVDIDFADALQTALNNVQRQPVALNRTAANHIAAQGSPAPIGQNLLYHQPSQAAVDGNTVEMDVERSKFTENAVRYEFAIQQVGGDFKDMLKLFTSLT